MPFSLRTEPLGSNKKTLAFMYGPLVLATEVDTNKVPAIVGNTTNLFEAFKPIAGKPNHFRVSSDSFRAPRDINGSQFTFEPYYLLHQNRPQIVYWNVLTPDQWARHDHPEQFRRPIQTNAAPIAKRPFPGLVPPSRSLEPTNSPSIR